MKLDYMNIYERALKMTWQRKILWLFGFLSLFGGCGANNVGTNFNYNFSGGGGGGSSSSPFSNPHVLEQLRTYLPIIILGAIFLFLIGIVLFVVGYIARAGLIKMASEFDSGGNPGAGAGFGAGAHYWLRLLGIDLTIFLPVFFVVLILIGLAVLVIVLLAPGMFSGFGSSAPDRSAAAFGGVCLIFVLIGFLILLLIPVIIFLGVLQTLAHRACVLDDRPVFDSIRSGYRLIRTRFGDVALVWLIRLAIGIGVSLAMLLVVLLVIGIPIALMFVNVFVGVLLLIPGGFVILFLSGVVEAFTSAAWTLAYKDMTAPAVLPAAAAPAVPAT